MARAFTLIPLRRLAAAVAALAVAASLTLAGCGSEAASSQPGTINGSEVEFSLANLDKGAQFFTYQTEAGKVGLLAVKDSTGAVRVALDTCQVCNGSPKAYFLEKVGYCSARTAATRSPMTSWATRAKAASQCRWIAQAGMSTATPSRSTRLPSKTSPPSSAHGPNSNEMLPRGRHGLLGMPGGCRASGHAPTAGILRARIGKRGNSRSDLCRRGRSRCG